jgi:beta-phosphoglucomutase
VPQVRILPGAPIFFSSGVYILPSLSSLSAVIFDCDGILVDSEPLHYRAFQQVLTPLGLTHDYQQYLNRYIGYDDRDAFVEVFRDAGRTVEADNLKKLIEAKNAALLQIISEGVNSFPGVVRLVRELFSLNVPLAVASGSLRLEIENFIEALGLKDCFRVIVAADDVRHSKPDPETYLLTLHKLQETLQAENMYAQSCVAIEDTPAGIESAKGAGLFVIGVANSFPPDQLYGADYVLKDLATFNVSQLSQLCTPA